MRTSPFKSTVYLSMNSHLRYCDHVKVMMNLNQFLDTDPSVRRFHFATKPQRFRFVPGKCELYVYLGETSKYVFITLNVRSELKNPNLTDEELTVEVAQQAAKAWLISYEEGRKAREAAEARREAEDRGAVVNNAAPRKRAPAKQVVQYNGPKCAMCGKACEESELKENPSDPTQKLCVICLIMSS